MSSFLDQVCGGLFFLAGVFCLFFEDYKASVAFTLLATNCEIGYWCVRIVALLEKMQ